MKHFFKTIMLGVAALTLAACTQSNNQNAENASDTTTATVEEAAPAQPELKEDGIYAAGQVIKLGDKISDLPQSIEGLYDAFSVTEGENMDGDLTTDLLFTLNGEDVFSATSYDKATIAWISVGSPKIRFKVHDKFYGCGDDLSHEVKAKPDDFGWDDAFGGVYFYEEFGIPYDKDENTIMSINIGEMPF